ncbi:hypothetical protein A2483_00115 [Candidatus Peregrinibacteria bacterium RIFOXYC2_FULL_33_13]|nr:MAG: Phosphoribosylaminoimidazole-succinocarboxamide synthase [Candidatus Peregrinibacteria bacterium GW2011_GWA2_33_10]KKP39782.1 MAG: phosphoribosylaminoimidazole carboxylase, 5-(carboxyamino)imidazole ribonucleotide mutase [Candidatus Peregrinibacteria bacterium GW2011_GWC2_33_13]OGJ48235.1 MAG: hypothetical protein A2229_04810 [Candidatus Peregrinibacteria bacterium RIFOXYA2_FULL_33_7]OGJ52187.1 MAG: hypothetical protein A2483_00115 [Candidatus Peregrinibacteria bacterium RIFOXYC2_FULL_33
MKAVIIYASPTDKSFVTKITKELYRFRIDYIEHVASAHKVPEKIIDLIEKYNQSEEQICFITVAGRSNALSGLVSANTIFPVIACPPLETKEDFMVNINSSLMMPSETPVATIVDPANAAYFVAKMFGLIDNEMKDRVIKAIGDMKKKF